MVQVRFPRSGAGPAAPPPMDASIMTTWEARNGTTHFRYKDRQQVAIVGYAEHIFSSGMGEHAHTPSTSIMYYSHTTCVGYAEHYLQLWHG
jgi:hypothetical protein